MLYRSHRATHLSAANRRGGNKMQTNFKIKPLMLDIYKRRMYNCMCNLSDNGAADKVFLSVAFYILDERG